MNWAILFQVACNETRKEETAEAEVKLKANVDQRKQ